MNFVLQMVSGLIVFLYTFVSILPPGGSKAITVFAGLWFGGILVVFLVKGVVLRRGVGFIVSLYLYLAVLSGLSVVFMAFDVKYGSSLLVSSLLPALFSLDILLLCKRKISDLFLFVYVQCSCTLVVIGYFYYKYYFVMQYGLNMRATGVHAVDSSLNAVASTLAVGAAISITVMLKSNNGFLKFINGICFALFTLGIGLSYSRASLAIVIIWSVGIVIHKVLGKYSVKNILASLTGIAFVFIATYYAQGSIFIAEWFSLYMARWKIVDDNLRYDTHRVAWELFQGNPVFGVGYSNFPSLFGSMSDYSNVLRMHNDIFESFVELGVVGGVAFLGIIVVSIIAWCRIYKINISRILFSGFFVVLAMSFVRPMQSVWIWHFFVLMPFVIETKSGDKREQ